MEYEQVERWQERSELSRLLDLSTPPKELYYQGKWDAGIFIDCVAVVGSRRMTEYGRRVLDKLVPQLVLQKKTIISGFMYGVDQYAHQLTVENGGKTIAVLGWGIGEPIANSDKPLAKKIIESGGLLISEWEEQKAMLWTFPARNRIVAALATDVYVIEAAVKSGSLITADLARKLKRKVWAVPGPITSRMSEGTNALIAKGLAQAWLGGQDVLSTKCDVLGSTAKHPITRILENEEMTADEISRKLNKPVAEVGAQLSLLTITGEVQERGGKYFI